jgi:hypothetical protein
MAYFKLENSFYDNAGKLQSIGRRAYKLGKAQNYLPKIARNCNSKNL